MADWPDLLGNLAAALDALCQADPALLADGESLVALHRQLERLEAATTRATAAFDAGGTWEADGARSAAAWVATRCHLPVPAARRQVRLGRALRHMPVVASAWVAGDIGAAHVAQLAEARNPATSEGFARDEAMLVSHAATLHYRQFVRTMSYWSQLADPDGVEHDAEAQHRNRRLHLSVGLGGTWILDGILDPLAGTIVGDALKRIEKELFESDWSEAKARVGEATCGADLARTPAQRRADALVEMARRAGAVPAGARMPEPLFTVLVGYETLGGRICELAQGQRHHPRGVAALAQRGVGGAGRVRRARSHPKRRRTPADVHRRHPPGGRGSRPGVLPRVLRRTGRRLRDRPRRALVHRRPDRRRQRPGGLRIPQPATSPTNATAVMAAGMRRQKGAYGSPA